MKQYRESVEDLVPSTREGAPVDTVHDVHADTRGAGTRLRSSSGEGAASALVSLRTSEQRRADGQPRDDHHLAAD
jgi:hypothetical protein